MSFGRDLFVIAGVGVDDATAARGHVRKPILVEGLEEGEDGAGPHRTLRIDECSPPRNWPAAM